MAIPNGGNCDITEEVCCTTLYDIGHNILDVALTAVGECANPTCGPDIRGFLMVGRAVSIPLTDYIAVSLVSMGLAPGARSRSDGSFILPVYRGVYQVRLLESGYDLVIDGDDQEMIVASEALIDAMSLHAYSHGEVMFRALANAVSTKSILDCGDCFAAMDDLIPVEPAGGTVGWQTQITVEVKLDGQIPVLPPVEP